MEEEEVVEEGHGGWGRNPFAGLAEMLVGLVVLLTILVETALAIRLAFRLGDANAGNNFVDFIYDVTGWLIKPFTGIFDNQDVNGGVFEPAIVIAMVVYLVAAALVITAIRMLEVLAGPPGGRAVTVH
jgi:hypothetical protein